MSWCFDNPWLCLDRFATVLGLVTVFTVIGFGLDFWRRVQRNRRRIRLQSERAAGRTSRPVALALSFPKSDTVDDVQRTLHTRFRASHAPLLRPGAAVTLAPGEFGVVEFQLTGKLTPVSAYRELERLRELKEWLEREGFTEVHLFLQTPVAFGAVVGSLFTNWRSVHLYHWDRDRTAYEYWLPLSEAKALPEDLGSPAEGAASAAAGLLEIGRPPDPAVGAGVPPSLGTAEVRPRGED